jgi:predicted DNA-binding mobile mystery protein A
MDPVKVRGRKRLDERLARLRDADVSTRPAKGWVKAIREALGMSGKQLAERLKIAPQNVDLLEKSEEADTIQLKTLRRAAAAMDCTLVYALVPNSSLEAMVKARATELALRDLGRVAHTMKLEAQQVDDQDLQERIEAYIRDTLKDRDLWKTPPNPESDCPF